MAAPLNGMSYWQQYADGASQVPSVDPPADADVVIIGGGLAGLSAAIAILERQPGLSPVVLESEFVGFGASGRNGGLLSPLPVPVWLLTADDNADHAWALRILNSRLHALGAGLAAKVPESEIRPCTLRLQAMGRLSASGLAKVAATLQRAAIGYSLAPDPARDGKPTLDLPAHTVDPYRLVRALAVHAVALGARICERARVESIEETRGGALVRLAGGRQVRAGRVLVCTNAYTSSIAMASPPRAKVVRNYMVATETLSEDAVARLGNGRSFMVELNKSYVFYRLHEGRLVYGGVETFFRTPKSDYDVPASIRTSLERHLSKSVPWCKDIRIATQWGGAFHSTATDLPIIRRAHGTKAIVFNVGYGGTGVALTQLFSHFAAATLLDLPCRDAEETRLCAILQNTKLPLKNLLQFGASVAWDVVKGGAMMKGR
jgi:gamma-glutamylputrescine oxidase